MNKLERFRKKVDSWRSNVWKEIFIDEWDTFDESLQDHYYRESQDLIGDMAEGVVDFASNPEAQELIKQVEETALSFKEYLPEVYSDFVKAKRFHQLWNMVVHKKKSPYDIYIGRPSKFGNPFSHLERSAAEFKVHSREEAIAKYEEWIRTQPELLAAVKAELKNKILGCFCRPDTCHGDVLVKIANEE